MSRIRYIKPGFFTDEDLGDCSPLARLLFAGLWTEADRAGRLEDRPRRLKARLLPYDDCSVGELLTELASHGDPPLIVRYEVDGHRYIAIPGWAEHQKPHQRELPSGIPEPTEHNLGSAQAQPRQCSSTEKAGLGTTQAMPSPASRARVTGNGERLTGNGELKNPPVVPPVDNSSRPVDAEDSQGPLPEVPVSLCGPVSKIVGVKRVDELLKEGSDLNTAVACYLVVVDAMCEKTLAELPAAKLGEAKERCRRDAFDVLAAKHTAKPIANLAAYLMTAGRKATGLSGLVSDELVSELRSSAHGKRLKKAEPRRISEAVPSAGEIQAQADRFLGVGA